MIILKFVHYNNIRKHFLPNRVSEVRRPSIACQKITLAISTCFDAALLYFARAFQFLIIHCQIQGVPFKKETKISATHPVISVRYWPYLTFTSTLRERLLNGHWNPKLYNNHIDFRLNRLCEGPLSVSVANLHWHFGNSSSYFSATQNLSWNQFW